MDPEQSTGVSAAPMEPPPLPRFEELGLETNYMKLGEKVYAVKQIGAGFNVDAEMREFYKTKVETLTTLTSEAVFRDINNEHQAQIQRIQDARSRGQVAIPRDKIGKCVAYTQQASEVMEVVPIVYHPWQVIGTKSQLREYFGAANEGPWQGIAAEDETAVYVSNNIYVPAFVGIGRRTQKLWMLGGLLTAHTMSSQGDLCIGSSPFSQYAALAANPIEMSKQISVINLFSPAQRAITFGTPAQVIEFETLFKDMCTITKVEKLVRTQWQTTAR